MVNQQHSTDRGRLRRGLELRSHFMVSNAVIDGELSCVALACYVYLCRFEASSPGSIGQHFNLSPDDVQRGIRELEARGFVEREQPHEATPATVRKQVDVRPGYIYILQAGPFYKIGLTRDLDQRRRTVELQLPFPASIVFSVHVDDMFTHERQFHELFADKRMNGEWFDLTDEDLAAIRQMYLTGGA